MTQAHEADDEVVERELREEMGWLAPISMQPKYVLEALLRIIDRLRARQRDREQGYPVGLPSWVFPCGCALNPEYRVMRTTSEPTDRWIPAPCEVHR